jgi:hypothetical protein
MDERMQQDVSTILSINAAGERPTKGLINEYPSMIGSRTFNLDALVANIGRFAVVELRFDLSDTFSSVP